MQLHCQVKLNVFQVISMTYRTPHAPVLYPNCSSRPILLSSDKLF